MNKYMVQVLYLCMAGYFQLQGMQHAQTQVAEVTEARQKHQIIYADFMVIPAFGLKYAGYHPQTDALHDKYGNKLELNPKDILVNVYLEKHGASVEEQVSCQIVYLLPLSWLEDKKEGDVLEFVYDNNSQNCARVYFKLTCKQLDTFAAYYGDFSAALAEIKNKFAYDTKKLEYHEDRDRLIEDRIIERVVDYQGNILYIHGQNGFKMKPVKKKKMCIIS